MSSSVAAARLRTQDPPLPATRPATVLPDARSFRNVMGHLPTGVTVIAAGDGDERHGMTANSVTAVSLDPLMILACLTSASRTASAIRSAGRFAINFLAEHQEELSRRFARPGDNHFVGIEVEDGPHRVPVIPGCVAYVACRVADVVPAGDHHVVFGEVEHCEAFGGRPLVFHRGAYCRLPDEGT